MHLQTRESELSIIIIDFIQVYSHEVSFSAEYTAYLGTIVMITACSKMKANLVTPSISGEMVCAHLNINDSSNFIYVVCV